MKRKVLIPFITDILILLLGLSNYIFPDLVNTNPNVYFYVELVLFSLINLDEFMFNKKEKEPIYLFVISIVTCISFTLLRFFDASLVLSLTIAFWAVCLVIVKIISLEDIYKNRTHLFIAKLTQMSVLLLFCILISVNLYFHISMISYMLAFLYSGYAILELFYDFLAFLSQHPKFMRE